MVCTISCFVHTPLSFSPVLLPSPSPSASSVAAPLRRQFRQQASSSPLRSVVSFTSNLALCYRYALSQAPSPLRCLQLVLSRKQKAPSPLRSVVSSASRLHHRRSAPSSAPPASFLAPLHSVASSPSPFRRIQLAISRNQAVPTGSTHYTYIFVVTKCYMFA